MSKKGIEITESTATALAAAVRWLDGRDIPIITRNTVRGLRAISAPEKLGDNLVFKIEFWVFDDDPRSKAEVTVTLEPLFGRHWVEKYLSFTCPILGYFESHPAEVFRTEDYKLWPVKGTPRLY